MIFRDSKGIVMSFALLSLIVSQTCLAMKPPTSEELRPDEVKRKAEVLEADVFNLRTATEMVRDSSSFFLQIPSGLAPDPGFVMAKEPPVIDFIPMQGYEPEFFPAWHEGGLWSSWGQSVYAPQTGCFYSAIGDHAVVSSNIFIYEFDPRTLKHRIVLDVNKFLGRRMEMTRDGKVHGWLRVMENGDLIFATYNAAWPQIKESSFESGYDGGHIVKYNVVTGEAEDLGCPMLRSSWPFHSADTKRGMFFAAGLNWEFMAFDVYKKKMLFGGYLPKGMKWENRTMMVDEATGLVYANNSADATQNLISYNPATNQFRKLKSTTPKYPLPRVGNNLPRANDDIRCHTDHRTKDGAFYLTTYCGVLFKFWPDEDRTEFLTLNWDNGRYCGSMALSPGERYLYYLPGSHGEASFDDVPVVQYDTVTGTKKVLGFMGTYYRQKYGYTLGGTFSVRILPDGSALHLVMNGRFEPAKRGGYEGFGNPSYMMFWIPESERVE